MSTTTTSQATNMGEKAKKLAAVLGPAELSIGVALGCMLGWVPMAFQSLNMVGDAAENVLDTVYLVSIVALTATFAVIALTYRNEGTFISKPPIRIASTLGMAVSTALIAVAGNASQGSTEQLVLAWIAGILSGVSSAVFLMQFGMLISKFNTKNTVAIAATGYIVSSALFCLYSFFGELESCIFAVSMPLVSAILRTSGANTAKGKHLIEELATPKQEPLSDPSERAHLAHLTRALALCAAFAGFTNELARTLYIQMGIAGVGNENYALIQAGASLVVGLGATLLTIALLSMKTARAPEYCYRILMVFLALGALLLPAPLLFENLSVVIPYSLNAAAYQCFGILAWVLACGVCQRYPSTSVRTFASIRAGWAAGPLIGLLIGRYVVSNTGFGPTETYLCAFAGTLVIFLISGLAFTERDLAVAVNLLPTDRRRRFTDKCLSVAARCGLSERETEIMMLFAKGRNLAYIQEELCVSKSTVSTHRQHIYQKLDVHSSQEMIDLIQAEKI